MNNHSKIKYYLLTCFVIVLTFIGFYFVPNLFIDEFVQVNIKYSEDIDTILVSPNIEDINNRNIFTSAIVYFENNSSEDCDVEYTINNRKNGSFTVKSNSSYSLPHIIDPILYLGKEVRLNYEFCELQGSLEI